MQSISVLGSREPAESQEEKEAKVFQYMVHPFEVEGVDPGGPVVLRLVFPTADCPPRMSVHVGLPVRCVGFHFAVDAPFDLVASRADLHEGVSSRLFEVLDFCNAGSFQHFNSAVLSPDSSLYFNIALRTGSTVNQILCNAIPQAFGDFSGRTWA